MVTNNEYYRRNTLKYSPKVVSIDICIFSGELVYIYIQYGGWRVQGGGTFSEGTTRIFKKFPRSTFNKHLQINNGTTNNIFMK